MGKITYFGIRHLSPVCAYYLRELLQNEEPGLVLIEGPSDLNGLMDGLVSEEAELPAAILAYTKEPPVETVLYPFAEFSPEYQAILWAKEKGVKARFIDLPSGIALGYYKELRRRAEEAEEEMSSRQSTDEDGDKEDPDSGSPEQNRKLSVYEQIEQLTGIPHDSIWEYTFEGCSDREELASAMEKYGASLREFSEADKDSFKAEHEALRECFMRRMIAEAAAEDPDRNIVVVTGAFHTAAVKEAYSEDDRKKTDAALASKQNLKDCNATLMPYSYYRLSEHSGYGAGAKAPGYFEILWRCRNASGGAPGGDMAASEYLTRVAAYQRLHGGMASSAQVIEALRLAKELAAMNGGKYPALADLRSSAVTCIGEGSFAEIATAVASTEIGTRIGQMPEGAVCTSVQEDFLRQLKVLKLERFRSSERQDLELDLRENLRVKSQEAAFLDLNRSFFLHRMSVLQTGFSKQEKYRQDTATWAEKWSLQWTPETEIRIVEASLKGDTLEEAAVTVLGEMLRAAENVKQTSAILAKALEAGLTVCVREAIYAVQNSAAGNEAIQDVGCAIGDLSLTVRFGNIRRMDLSGIEPLMERLFLKFCLNLQKECICDEAAAKAILPALATVWDAVQIHEFLDKNRLIHAFIELAEDDMANPLLSGFACGALAERGDIDAEKLYALMERHLAKGMPSADGAYWFEGLAEKNHRALIARLGIWEHLAAYIRSLDEEEFRSAAICLRRTFSTFSPAEKLDIAENICEILGVNATSAAAYVNGTLSEEESQAVHEAEQNAIGDVDDFDFDI